MNDVLKRPAGFSVHSLRIIVGGNVVQRLLCLVELLSPLMSQSRLMQGTLLYRMQHYTRHYSMVSSISRSLFCLLNCQSQIGTLYPHQIGKKQNCINAIASDKRMEMKVCKVTSEELGLRKRRCQDLLFNKLGYLYL